jgi:LPXTG-site transpeptidase (sortase) family protein
MLSFSAGRYVEGGLAAQRARDSWNSAEARVAVALARSANRSRPGRNWVDDGAPVARLVIPSIDLDEIVLEGADELNAGPGHVAGSAFPGGAGNAIISGERDRAFSHLDAVNPGDTVVTESGLARDSWIVVSKRIVGRDDRLVNSTSDTTLTLTTSWPIRYVGPAPERLIVTATRVAPPGRIAPSH